MTDSVSPAARSMIEQIMHRFLPLLSGFSPLSGRGAHKRPAFFYSRSPMASSSFCSARFSMRET